MGVARHPVPSERGPRVKVHRNAKTTPSMRALIVQRVRQQQWPPAEASTVSAVLARAGLNRLAQLEPPPPACVRYERTRPGELVHLDVKPLGRILRVGHRIDRQHRASVGAGWEYVHVAVDDYSRAAPRRSTAGPNRRHGGGVSAAHRGLVCSAGPPGVPGADRQRGRLHQPPLSAARGPVSCAAHTHAPLSPANQRQGRAVHPDADPRLGLSGAVPELLAPHPSAASLASSLLHGAAARRTQVSTTVRPLSEGRAMINLARNHT